MRIIISPAKKMNVDVDGPFDVGVPSFLEQTARLLQVLQTMDGAGLQRLWKCNDALAKLNIERLNTMDLHHRLTPAIFAYEGIQYRYMAPHVLEADALAYLQQHLRIVSGFYGLLRPFDGVTPYRLELQAKLSVDGHQTLYGFWGATLADALTQETDWVLNLASHEYSRAIIPHLPAHVKCITCIFGERKGDAIVEKGTQCKMARGQMVRYLAEHAVTDPIQVTQFNALGFAYAQEESTPTQFVFIKGDV